MYKAMDHGKIGGVVFLDLKKAFDMVDHAILARKLQSLGVSDVCLPWFVSYLSNRQQSTKVENVRSDSKPISHGVPQGSILGPLLFSVYINNLCDMVELCGTLMYAMTCKVLNIGCFKISLA